METDRLEDILVRISKLYLDLRDEIIRFKQLGEAREDSQERFELNLARMLKDKNTVIQKLSDEIRNVRCSRDFHQN